MTYFGTCAKNAIKHFRYLEWAAPSGEADSE